MEKLDGHNIRKTLAQNRADELSKEVHDTLIAYADSEERWRQLATRSREELEKEIRNEHDVENAALKERLRFCVASLHSEKELERYKAFCEKHEACRLDKKAYGGMMPYVIQFGTGIGVCTEVVCQVCGANKDITDTAVW